MWNRVKGTQQEEYIANPVEGSNHNFGMAVDLSILDENGQPLDMGTRFDDFAELSQPRLEEKFLSAQKLSREHHNNRLLLRTCMEQSGFHQFSTEWWHFDALPRVKILTEYKIVE